MSSYFWPLSLNSEDKINDDSIKKGKPYKIFFRDLFLFKENEIEARRQEKALNRSGKLHQKSTFSSRMKSRSHLSEIAYADAAASSFEKFGLDPTLVLRITEGADAKRSLHEFINDQRGRFLLQYAVQTKKNTITRYDKHILTKERQILRAETKLQEDAIAFEEFLRENDQRSVDALKIAAQETINKLQMTAELKKATMEVQAVKSEISKTEFLLREYIKYGLFLMKLSPKHWQIRQALRRVKMSKSKENIEENLSKILTKFRKIDYSESSRKISVSGEHSRGRSSSAGKQRKKRSPTLENGESPSSDQSESSEDSLECLIDDEIDYELEPEIYFKEPEELLQVLTELEEQNLTLVQYSQDVDENLEEVNKREKYIQDKINSNIEFLLEQKEVLKENCVREEEKAAELELRSRLFSFGEFNSDAQKQALGQNAIWRQLNLAQQFIETLLAANAEPPDEKEDESYLSVPKHIPKHVTYKLEHINYVLKRRNSQEKLIESLSKKINQVYKFCIGDGEVGSLNPVQKLVKVESRLVELSDLIDSIPKENVEAIERIKQKERRQRFREDKMREKQKHQEERLRAALERAVAQPKKKVGRRLVCRSKPTTGNKHQLRLVRDTRAKSIEEEYFFT
ncbi:coiled-coil domain-containing protein 38 isoform X1 [Eptesicus fuscus]|uniref:coiled-coil domain-containing protein 38 isoform X1 n=2 Tax=Eptesicus fuscus TaxID=29078 RepID=UPI00101A7368|nr:coiled-coil domain-containing protein 38 isoform X1 [Eptesicus fuscus]